MANTKETPVDTAELNRAEEFLISSGHSMTHDQIRQMLQSEGVQAPVIDHVLAGGVARQLKKTKSGTTIAWE